MLCPSNCLQLDVLIEYIMRITEHTVFRRHFQKHHPFAPDIPFAPKTSFPHDTPLPDSVTALLLLTWTLLCDRLSRDGRS